MKVSFPRLFRLAGVVFLIVAMLPSAVSSQMPAGEEDGSQLVLVNKVEGEPLPENLTVLEDYGSFVLAEMPPSPMGAMPQLDIMDLMADRTVISLNGNIWDTRAGEPSTVGKRVSPDDDPYFLVQFYGPIKKQWLADLEALGVTFLAYYPNYAYIVRMEPSLVGKAQAAHAVQWVGRYHPAYRLASDEELASAQTDGDRLAVEVSTFAGVDVEAFQKGLEAAGAEIALVETMDDGAMSARVWAARDRLEELAALRGVFRVEPYSPPVLFNDKTGQTAHTWDVWKAGRNGLLQDLMGAGQIAGIVDSGLDNKTTSPTIEDFYDYTGGTTTSRVVYNQNGAGCTILCACTATDSDANGGHGTHAAGSIVANGYNSLAQRGLTAYATAADPSFDYAWGVGQAPESQIAVIHAGGTGGGICVSAQTDWTTLYNQGAHNVNNSWGNSTYTYGGNSRTADYIMWTYQDYLIVASAGNTGPVTSRLSQPANAKNILSVGAAQNHRPAMGWYADTASLLVYFSARGPVSTSGDTRFKPDIVAAGGQVLSTRSNYLSTAATVGLWGNEPGDGDGDGKPDYAWSGGTSMSSPQVTGAATIVRDYFQDIQGLGNATPPSAALIKAALVNGAVDMGYGYDASAATPYGGRNLQGWGYMNIEQAVTPRAPRSFFFDDFTNITNNAHQSTIGPDGSGDYVEYTAVVADSTEPLKITLTWTDYATTRNSSYAVNNLNLLVTAPDATQYYGNNFSGSWSVTGGAYDTVNNTEAVYIQNPAAGTWTIRVTAANAPSGSYQPFALFASGGLGVNPSYTRACSGIGSCAGRMGSSGQTYGGAATNYFPSLKPVTQALEHAQAGRTVTAQFRLTNGGRSADSINLSSAVTTMTGAAASGITVTFDQSNPIALASGASVDVTATVGVTTTVGNGSYDVLVTAASTNAGNRSDAIAIPLNVIGDNEVSNEGQAMPLPGAQVTADYWASGATLWAAYLSGESHNSGEGEVWASCSDDGGVTWTNVGQVDAGDGAFYYGPVVAGNSTGSSVTFVWLKPNLGVYARTWTRTSGCTGTWRNIVSLVAYPGGNYRINYPDVIYDTDGTILATWRKNDNAAGGVDGIFSNQSTNDGLFWGTATGVPDASGTDAAHIMGQLALDAARNEVWMAYVNSANAGNIYLKRWVGSTNAWDAAGTNHVAVATTANVETRPGIGYVSATNSLWVTWHRYVSDADASARLYYVRSTAGSLPTPTWGTTYQYPVGVRTAEEHPAMVEGDADYAYITYEAYSDGFRGNNLYALKVPAAGGAPDTTCQISATTDNTSLFAGGNAGSPRLQWATTTLNDITMTGPSLLYTKNVPQDESPNYAANLGVSQTLFNLEENFNAYLCQVCQPGPTEVTLSRFDATAEEAGIVLEWETTSEIDTLGFNVYRSDAADGPRGKLNAQQIPTLVPPGSSFGASYRYVDSDVTPGATYYYWLEDLDIRGHAEVRGPAVARAAGQSLRLGSIRMEFRTTSGWLGQKAAERRYTIAATANVLDAAGQPVAGARVAGRWGLPDDSAKNQLALSGKDGGATFGIAGMQPGAYELCVTGVTKQGWGYDPAQNAETCVALTIP